LLKQFDIVKILSVKGIRFLSGPQGKATDPNGLWSVVGIIGTDVVIAKDETIVRAPLSAVSKVASYESITKMLEKKHGKPQKRR